MRAIELLAPAKNLECGIAAVDHGADAVYIGADRFGARAAAGNTITDIAELVRYAHRFRVKVYVAINTVLTDEQLPEACKLIQEVYNVGADAIIIQDMGILQLDIPPIPIHASTQTDNRTLSKVQFLEKAGFSRVVLARELTLRQIQNIAENTAVELEVFVHGALCVSYSGQCYISQAMSGRSANRGECAQYCRLSYDLYDGDGNQLERSKHLLSLKDLDLSDSLQELLDAGVTSLKIEGRLKDVEYVKNITAYYRQKLDDVIDASQGRYIRSSSGRTTVFFTPDPEKSFRRSATDYFLNGRHSGIHQPETPKSLGEFIGKVTAVGRNFIDVETSKELHPGDGLCFITTHGGLSGFSVNKIDKPCRIYPNQMPESAPGTIVYRNQDHAFDKALKSNTSERKISVAMVLKEAEQGFVLELIDEDSYQVSVLFEVEKQEARRSEGVEDNLQQQLGKLGSTIFQASSIKIKISKSWFIPASVVNEWRRRAVEELERTRENAYQREKPAQRIAVAYPEKRLTYLGNVTNEHARQFYLNHGVEVVHPGFEVKAEKKVPLMFTKHCIKFEMGWCPRDGQTMPVAGPLTLRHGQQRFRLEFDCKKCEMHVYHHAVNI